MNDRVLVTGATGFIGHHVVSALIEKGDQVTCLVRPTSDTSRLPTAQLFLQIGDITDPTTLEPALASVGVVYHLAAALTAKSAQGFHSVNEVGTRNLAEACARSSSPPTLVVLSSLAAAGPNPKDRPRSEHDPSVPISNYGRSKLAGEQAARALGGLIPLTIVRAPIVFGQWDRDVFKMFRLVKLGIHLVPVAPNQRYSLIHATDLARLLVQAAADGERAAPANGKRVGPGSESSGLYYAAYDEQLTYADLGIQLAEALGRRRVRSLRVPNFLAWTVAAGFELFARLSGQPPDIINFDKAREGFAGSWSCSPAKAHEQLGFKPAQPLPVRLRQTAEWYRAQGWL
ncbi:MAG: NAD-dependent epimerase/dehydratase family protein [Chloroflexota bacterium]